VRLRLLLPLALLAACRGGAAPGEATLLVGRASDAIGLDPARVTDGESVEVAEQIFEHLVRTRRSSSEIQPALATRWERSADGKEWTFHLRRGVRFHDGTPLDADAVVFSLERQRDPAHPYHLPDFAYGGLFKNIVRIEKVDPETVRIAIEEPYAPFLANLSMFPMSIVSPTAVRRWGEAFRAHPVGTGPFRFVEWSRGERITLEANPAWWAGRPALSHLAFVPVRDPRQRLLALEGGAIDVAESLAPQDLQFVLLHPELQTERVAGFNVGYLAMNLDHPPFGDARVRRAVALAIRKDPIVKLVYQGLAVEATGPLSPSMWGHVDAARTPYDPVQARLLLREAGWANDAGGAGGERPPRRAPRLYVMSTPRPYMPAPDRVARMIAQDLHDVGMDVEIVENDITRHLRATERGEHDLCLLGWSADNGDPDNVLYTLFHSEQTERGSARNLSFLRDAELDGILRWAQESLDPDRRETFYARAQGIIAERVPWVPIAHSEIVVAQRRRVHGLWLPPTSTLYFDAVTLDAE
jgi:peptide/nickel transport system substrate-binding protein